MQKVYRVAVALAAVVAATTGNTLAQTYTTPMVPDGISVVPHASADGTVYVDDMAMGGGYAYDPSTGYNLATCPPTGDFAACQPQYCEQPYCQTCPPCQAPVDPLRWRIWGGYLYLHAVGADMQHAYQQNGTGGAGTTPFGAVGVTDPHFDGAYQIGGSVELSKCTRLEVEYTFFNADAISSIDAPAIADPSVASLVHHPGADVTSSAGPVSADYEIEFQTAKALFRRTIHADCYSQTNVSVGGRFANLDQNFVQRGVFSGSQGGQVNTFSDIDFDGAGLHFGLDGEHRLGDSRLSVYGKTSFSSVFGSFSSNYRMHRASAVTDLAIVRWNDDRVVPILEYEAGLAWTGPRGFWRFSVGYTGMHWFNVITTPELIDAVQANNYVDVGDTLSFGGLTSRVEWTY